jgi:hypothetical protein
MKVGNKSLDNEAKQAFADKGSGSHWRTQETNRDFKGEAITCLNTSETYYPLTRRHILETRNSLIKSLTD